MNAGQVNADRSSKKARFIKLGPGEALETRVDIAPLYLLKAGAAHTDGQYSVLEVSVGHELPLHIHETADELFFLLDGTLRVTFDDEQHEVGPGSFMFLPAGVPHAIKPLGRPCRVFCRSRFPEVSSTSSKTWSSSRPRVTRWKSIPRSSGSSRASTTGP